MGEIGLLHEEMAPRAEWKLCRIVAKKVSSDGEVRAVTIQMPNGKELERPVNMVYPLEIDASTKEADKEQEVGKLMKN